MRRRPPHGATKGVQPTSHQGSSSKKRKTNSDQSGGHSICEMPQVNVKRARQESEVSPKDWRCIYCNKQCSNKGNMRKHIVDQHVARKFQKCDGCGEISTSVPKAMNHGKVCPQGTGPSITTSFSVAKDEKKVYGSEFTGDFFASQRDFVDHLLELSWRPTDSKLPFPSKALKLRALLHQPAIRVELQMVCQH